MKKLLALLLAVMTSLTCAIGLTACGGGGSEDSGYGDKSVIAWANCGGGIGRAWLDDAASRYCEINKDVSFEDGKTGVAIDVTASHGTGQYINSTDGHDLITFEYFDVLQYASQDLLMDLTEFYYRESKYDPGTRLIDKIIPESRAQMAVNSYNESTGTYEAKFYAIPHYEFLSGATYDRELFEKYDLFFCEDQSGAYGTLIETPFGNAYLIGDGYGDRDDTAVWSYGPNFETGINAAGQDTSLDDGLPKSLQELAILCYYMKNEFSVYPFQYPGQYSDYSNILLCGLDASLTGYEALQAFSTFEGRMEIIDGLPQTTTDGGVGQPQLYWNKAGTSSFQPLFQGVTTLSRPTTKWISIDQAEDNTTGWYTQEQVGKYYAMAFHRLAVENNWYSPNSKVGTVSHTDSEMFFLTGGIGNNPEVAMLCESTYWWNEANNEGVLDEYESLTAGLDPNDKDVRFMALPSVLTNADYDIAMADENGRRDWSNTMIDTGYCAVFALKQAGNDPQHKELVLDFLDFLYITDELENFTKFTGMYRPLNYQVSDSDLSELSIFVQEFTKMRRNGKVVRHSGDNAVYANLQHSTGVQIWGKTWCVSGHLTDLIKVYNNGYTIYDVFEARRMTPGVWRSHIAATTTDAEGNPILDANGVAVKWVDFGLDEMVVE